jgi:hypothetical protein
MIAPPSLLLLLLLFVDVVQSLSVVLMLYTLTDAGSSSFLACLLCAFM